MPDTRWPGRCLKPDTSGVRLLAHSHNAHGLKSARVYYRWHPLFGLTLPIRRRERRREGESLVCESPSGRLLSLPCWMCSPECLQFSLGSPLISTAALDELRALLDVCHTSSDCDKASCRLPQKEDADEKIRNAAGPADESVATRRSAARSLRPTKGTDACSGRTTYKRRAKRS